MLFRSQLVLLQQSTVSVSAPRVLIEQVDHIKATVQVDSKENDNLNQRVKLTAVDVDGKEVTGVNLATKSINAEIKFLEEKNVPINIQQQGDSEDIKSYEVNPKEVILKGKKEILDKITYIKTEKIDLSTIGVSKKINLIIPEGVTLEQTSITIKPKDNFFRINFIRFYVF